MVSGFFDTVSGGFFDTSIASHEKAALGILGTRRKPFQDSPTPSGNSAAAIALLRLHGYTNDGSADSAKYHDMAEQTLEIYAGVAGQHGIFAATFGLAVARFVQSHAQVVVIGKDAAAAQLYQVAVRPLSFNTAVLHLDANNVVAENLPPALAQTITKLPALDDSISPPPQSAERRSFAVVCSGFTCQPPIFEAEDLALTLGSQARPAA
jgi:hypothetical protein